ncbi:MAG: homoserine kinase [Wenzhouxiangella sp.]|nr:homoserine kinase [Wenzhouxiangella sp.]
MRASQTTAFAPASVGNVGVGFDLLGHAIEGPGDTVTARRSEQAGVRISAIEGVVRGLPLDSERNTAGRAVMALLEARQPGFGVELVINKGIPLSSGLGGSAASAVAALVASNALLDEPLEHEALYPFALAGEAIASGAVHGDNVGPQLLGGLVLATADRLISIPVPEGLLAVVVHPDCQVETRRARESLARPFDINTIVAQSSHLAQFLAGCYSNDLDLVAAGLADVLVEPRRAHLIPGFEAVKQAALAHGALGASISGAGPSVFSWFTQSVSAHSAASAMQAAFAAVNLDSQAWITPVQAPGARLLAP